MGNTSLTRINPQDLIFGSIVFFSGEVPAKILNGDKGIIFLTESNDIGEFIKSDDSWEMWVKGNLLYRLESSIYNFITEEIKNITLSESKEKIKELILDPDIQYRSRLFLSIIYQQVLKMLLYNTTNGNHQLETLPFSIVKTNIGLHIAGLN